MKRTEFTVWRAFFHFRQIPHKTAKPNIALCGADMERRENNGHSGMTMTEVVDRLYDDYDWSRSVPNLSGKLRRGSLRYQEAVELADVLDYDIVWVKRKR